MGIIVIDTQPEKREISLQRVVREILRETL